jgi:hypothetical protein
MGDETFSTPEEVALAGFPAPYARVDKVKYSRRGDRATVRLLTNEEPYLYPYYVDCARDTSGRWYETGSHN